MREWTASAAKYINAMPHYPEPCRFFRSHSGCKYGDTCNFSHQKNVNVNFSLLDFCRADPVYKYEEDYVDISNRRKHITQNDSTNDRICALSASTAVITLQNDMLIARVKDIKRELEESQSNMKMEVRKRQRIEENVRVSHLCVVCKETPIGVAVFCTCRLIICASCHKNVIKCPVCRRDFVKTFTIA